MARVLGRHHAQRDRCHHEQKRRDRRRLGKHRRGAPRTESGLRAHPAEGTCQIGRFAALEQNDHDQEKTHNYVNDCQEYRQHAGENLMRLYQFRREPAAFEDGNMADRRFLYLHGFASGPNSSKARYFRDRFAALGIPLDVLDLEHGDFAGLTLSGMLQTIHHAAAGTPAVLIGSSLGGYLAALYAARHPEVERLVLLAPAFRFPTHYPATLGEAKLAAWRTSGKMPVFHYYCRRGAGTRIRLLS